ncbi:LysR family transcriptional regulator [Glaciimonas sp. CA11.2]|uniref:LysR family transcriptional regulator n=1 Tax=Glaciimonas sp. CA11.2 TaxID=3048601 RepID=UPI002AB521BA|nr:LysR family transcriptional regulator [Glaciimonas sp. CA11.2]MDY7546732.1 LysR family transcriptional regulator [Glaciimonas sp. CA11.2]MEB0162893.1 LysR family transcriptional regulator [Glaciimonas sp. CA11.2]
MQGRTLWELKVFCAVVEKHSFVTAARMMGISPSSATRTVQSLEAQLGVQLLQRSHKLLSLSGAGEVYYDFAKKMLEVQAEAEDEITNLQSGVTGSIRFSAPEIFSRFFLPEQIGIFTQDFSDMRIDVLYTDIIVDPIQENLNFSIRGVYPTSSELIGYPLWSYDRILCASPAYIKKHGTPIEPEDLSGHTIVLHTAPRVLKDWYFKSDARTLRMHMPATHRVNSGAGLYELIRTGMGVGRLASWVTKTAIENGELVHLCPAYRLVSSSGKSPQMHAVYGSKGLPRRAQMLLELLRAKGLEQGFETLQR